MLYSCSQLVPAIFKEAANGVGLFDSSDDTNKVTGVEKASVVGDVSDCILIVLFLNSR